MLGFFVGVRTAFDVAFWPLADMPTVPVDVRL
jgi:hypothetical protein